MSPAAGTCGRYLRDEASQAAYHRPDGDPRGDLDLDLASVGIVKVLDGATAPPTATCPEPKAAFATIAGRCVS